MKAAPSRPRAVCGALVGLFSALLSGQAHVAAGGHLPGGVGAIVLVLVCAAVGAATTAGSRGACPSPMLITTGLLVGQTFGHILMTVTAHHGSGSSWPSAQMALAHGAAALLLGVLISLVGHLSLVCASVLSWLRLIALHRAVPGLRRWRAIPSTLRTRLLPGGTRMRAPPRGVAVLG